MTRIPWGEYSILLQKVLYFVPSRTSKVKKRARELDRVYLLLKDETGLGRLKRKPSVVVYALPTTLQGSGQHSKFNDIFDDLIGVRRLDKKGLTDYFHNSQDLSERKSNGCGSDSSAYCDKKRRYVNKYTSAATDHDRRNNKKKTKDQADYGCDIHNLFLCK